MRRPQHLMMHWHHHHHHHLFCPGMTLKSCMERMTHSNTDCVGNTTRTNSHQESLDIVAASSHSTAVVAAYFAQHAHSAGDCFLLFGNVGAGKSHFRYARVIPSW